MSVTVCKETNMNIVSKSDFNFKGVQLSPVNEMGSVWFTSAGSRMSNGGTPFPPSMTFLWLI
jgi:hypothetical protein